MYDAFDEHDGDAAGWKTYNFEVAEHHTYVADDVRVHNRSGIVGRIGLGIDKTVDSLFGRRDGDGSFIDVVSDVVTAPFHIAGRALVALTSPIFSTFQLFGQAFTAEPGTRLDTKFSSLLEILFGAGAREGGRKSPSQYTEAELNEAIGNGTVREALRADVADGSYFHDLHDRFVADGLTRKGATEKVREIRNGEHNSGVSRAEADRRAEQRERADIDRDLRSEDRRSDNSHAYEREAEVDRVYNERHSSPSQKSGGGDGGKPPILLDLDDDGLEITELSKSTVFMDAGGDGLLHRTAWVGDGDGVLFIDDDGDGAISEKKEYVFTEWDPTATDDLAALRAVFDSNDDGVLDASDARFADFKVLVTNADGSTTAKTLTEEGITSIDLTADTTRIELPDGSMITGQTSFTRSDGSTGTVANATLVAEAQGYRVEQDESTNGAGDRVVVSTAYTATGDVAYVITSVTSPDGSSITNSYDDDGDGVVDRLQEISMQEVNGNKVETVVNKNGSDLTTAIVTSRVVTTTSADGSDVTIERDSTGGGWFDQEEIRTTAPDGSRSIVIHDLAKNGDVIRSSSETTTIDGLTRTKGTDENGDGLDDVTVTHSITEHADDSRTESTEAHNRNGSLRSSETMVVGPDGQSKTISRDVDGDGVVETVEDLSITLGTGGDSISVLTVRNGSGTTRSTVTQTQSADALTKTIEANVDGDNDIDSTTVDTTVIHGDGSRENTVTVTNTNGSVRSMQKTTLGADKVSSETWVDLDQDGVFDADERVRSVTVDGATQERTTLDQTRAIDGTVLASSTTVSSEDGLTVTSTTDADGDGDTDVAISDLTTVDGAGVSTQTIEMRNQDTTLRDKTVVETSADGLTTTTRVDIDGDGAFDSQMVDVRVLEAGDSITRTVSSYAGDGTTLLSRSTSTESADRRVMTTEVDAGGDGIADQITVSAQATDGTTTVTDERKAATGATITSSETWISANGLISRTTRDLDGDGITDVTDESTTVLNADGSRTQTLVTKNGDGSERSTREVTVRDDGLKTTIKSDTDGDGSFERVETSTTILKQNGEQVTTQEVRSEDSMLLSSVEITRSDDGLITTTRFDQDGDGAHDLRLKEAEALRTDGGVRSTSELFDGSGVKRSKTTTTTSDNGDRITTTADVNGDGQTDIWSRETIRGDGDRIVTEKQLSATGDLQSLRTVTTSADQLTTTSTMDADGDGHVERRHIITTTLNADGSRTTVTTEKDDDNTTYRSAKLTISDDGRDRTEAWDHNSDGADDLTMQTTLELTINGVETITEERRSANTDVLSMTATVTSADGRSMLRTVDIDGDDSTDVEVIENRDHNGQLVQDTTHFDEDGALDARVLQTVSANGLETTIKSDRDGDSVFEINTTDVTSLLQTGWVVRTITHADSNNIELAAETYETSDGGLFSRTTYDFDGDNQTDLRSEDTTLFMNSGYVSRTQETWDGQSNKLSSATWLTSGDGLATTYSIDVDENGHLDRSITTTNGASGGVTETASEFGIGGTLNWSMTRVVSEDGWSETQTYDRDGDTVTDREILMVTDNSRNVTVHYSDIPGIGLTGAGIVKFTSANGMLRRTEFDLDGDGTEDIKFVSQTSFNVSGDRIETTTETAWQNQKTYEEVTTIAADGLSSTMTFDMDGDGVLDGNSSSTTTLNADGSRHTLNETRYADGDLRTSKITDVSRDGRTTTQTFDFDGNGKDNLFEERFVATSGAETITEVGYNDDGDEISRHVTQTTADGRLTTINKNGVEQTISRSVTDNGTYTWDNGVDYATEGEHFLVSHTLDAFGIETWTSEKTWKDSGGATQTEAHSVRLDQASIARMLDEAARVYDTVLDRDMLREESEVLLQYASNGELDRPALVAALTSSDEFTTRYGTLSDALFITQIYLNSFARGASLAELDKHLAELAGGGSRDALAADVAESVEHLVIGNGHRITNNFDVLINPAEYERILDRAYVEMLITDLVDIVYDRAVTAHELAYLSSLLMEGSDTLADVAQKLLDLSGDIQGIAQNSVHGLSGAAFVERAYLNALERLPVAAEAQTWQNNLSSGRITQAEFLASLAQSVDHRGSGNVYETGSAPTPSVSTGTSGNNNLVGGSGQDDLRGLAGNDTLRGNAGADKLEGDEGIDDLRGGTGSDTYVWSRGDGSDTITDEGTSMIEVDALHLTDVLPADVSLQRNYFSNNLVIIIAGTGGAVIAVTDQFDEAASGGAGLESIQFSDGSTWTATEIDRNTQMQGTGTNSDDLIYAVSGDDSVKGREGNDWIDVGAGNDTLFLGPGADIGLGNTGDDSIKGGSGDDQIAGGQGADTIRGEDDDDTIWGDDGADSIYGDAGNDVLWGGAGNDTLRGAGETDSLEGGTGDDWLYGGLGNDTLSGGGGRDYLEGGAGADQLNGGEGEEDRVMYNASSVGVVVDLAAGTGAQGDAQGDVYIDIEQASGSEHNDHLSGNELDNVFVGKGGNDTLAGLGGNDRFWGQDGDDQINGGDGDDRMFGQFGQDTLDGGSGNDILYAGEDNDHVVGGDGNDTLHGGDGDDVISLGEGDDSGTGGGGHDEVTGDGGDDRFWGNEGNDTISGGAGNDLIYGEIGYDSLLGGGGSDTIWSGEGNDFVDAGSGNDNVHGGNGNDEIWLGDGADSGTGDNGDDRVFAGTGDDTFYGNDGSDELDGGEGNDTLFGESGNDTLLGKAGNDLLLAGTNEDTLNGGTGADGLIGGSGADVFVFTTGDGSDTIHDFEDGLDLIEFTGLNFSDLNITQHGADVQVSYGNVDTILIENLDTSSLTAQDFSFL